MSRKACDSIQVENVNKKVKHEIKKIEGKVLLMRKKNSLDRTKFTAAASDCYKEFVGHKVYLQLFYAHHSEGKLGKRAYLEKWCTTFAPKTEDYASFHVSFDWDEGFGVPGAIVVENHHGNEFFLKTVILEGVPGHGSIIFPCDSWVYPFECYKRQRVFFSNQTYLPNQTPGALRALREAELEDLRGTGTGKLEEWDRVYDYAVYNDLGDPDSGAEQVRLVLGGSSEYPYPRRTRTGRAPSKSDPNTERTLGLSEKLHVYVPRDERFNYIKMGDFLAYALKAILHFSVPELKALFDKTPNEFDSLDDVLKLYAEGVEVNDSAKDKIKHHIPELLQELFRSDSSRSYKFPKPQIIAEDKDAWKTDEEFAREVLAGPNPLVIRRLEEFPPRSSLDEGKFGNQSSSITEAHIKDNLDTLTVDQAILKGKMFILDHHDYLMPYLARINTTATKTYATRTLLFLKDDGTLKPLAIELSLPHEEGAQFGAESIVFTPAKEGTTEGTLWQLAKAYVAVNESGHHQLVSHWLRTHCAVEPFIIATNRQLSLLHPINKLLRPHFRDTMQVNAFARQTLINAGGILERTVYPGKFAMEMSAKVYKDWVFTDQALPKDLINRGMAVKDSNSPHEVKLLIEDYPFAVDGLEIWSAIKVWVTDYCKFYYKNDEMVQEDTELQSWWKEIREKGHGDTRRGDWHEMDSCEELINSCTIIIWVASALHAAINFGQYPYGGYPPKSPSMSRRFIPQKETPEYNELQTDPTKALLKTVTPQLQTVLGISLIEQLSIHSKDEVYLGDREENWTTDSEPIKALEKFNKKLKDIEGKITEMNQDEKMKNRYGPVKMPYTLLYRSS
ncbi:hypothetical protein Leryth_016389 [Lithospermum erythrorhizon]|nr:hypothetical protein Leryth_016389 [Lithospermum erythrorhizon]